MIKVNDLLKISLSNISLNKGRSFLTILGIVIGVVSIIVIMSVGDSTKELVLGEIKTFGPNNVFVLPGKKPSGIMDFSGTLLSDSLKENDYYALKNKSNVPDAARVVPYVFGPANGVYESNIYPVNVIGSVPDVKEVFSIKLSKGTFFDEDDVKTNQRVAVIGSKFSEEIFGFDNPIGKKIKINKTVFRVIGVMKQKGKTAMPIDIDKSVFAPYSSVQRYVFGTKHFQRIAVQASSVFTINNVKKDIERTLRIRHNISDPEKDDFFVQTQEDVAKNVDSILNILKILIASVAAVSLIVGGVGIMNVMFVAVTERSSEIGLRKALGASRGDIMKQFIVEAVFLTLIGGILGIIIGVSLSFIASFVVAKFTGMVFPFAISYLGVVIGVVIPILIGLIFGIFPALDASKKSPVEAMFYV